MDKDLGHFRQKNIGSVIAISPKKIQTNAIKEDPMKLTKKFSLFFSALSLSANFAMAQNYELATLLGTPNEKMPFVQEVVKNHLPLVEGNSFVDFTTGVLYFSWRNGVHSAQTIQIFQEQGNANLSDVLKALEIASQNSGIVLAPLSGTGFEEMCEKMAEKTETAFLISLGGVGYTLSPFYTKCASRNILFVTVLNPELTGLGEFASFGPLVRLAVPGMDLSAPVDTNRTASFLSDGFGMAVAAGKLASFSRSNPSLKGAALISQFLATTDYLPSLRGKITGAKAILHFEK